MGPRCDDLASASGGQPGRWERRADERLAAVRVAVQPDVDVAEPGEQVVVEAPDRAGRVAVPHRGRDGGAVDVPQGRAQLVDGGDPELEEQSGDPLVVLGARPAGARVPPRQEGRELGRADPRVELVTGVDASVTQTRLETVPDRPELPVGELQEPGGEGRPVGRGRARVGRNGALVADVVLELRPRVLRARSASWIEAHSSGSYAVGSPGARDTSRCRLA